MSALFGHVKGAFTGAVGARPGVCSEALMAASCCWMRSESWDSDEQAMLLRALEEKMFLPLGSDRGSEERLSTHWRDQSQPRGASQEWTVPRRSAGKNQPVDL